MILYEETLSIVHTFLPDGVAIIQALWSQEYPGTFILNTILSGKKLKAHRTSNLRRDALWS